MPDDQGLQLDGEDIEPSPPGESSGSAADMRDPEAKARRNVLNHALQAILSRYDYLKHEQHHLHFWVVEAQTQLRSGSEEKGRDCIARIEQEIEQEESTLEAAFNLFKPPTSDSLSAKEVKFMLAYLNFPATDRDVEDVLKAVDTDGDRMMSLVEFQQYVGRMGGSIALFEARKHQVEGKTSGSVSEVGDSIKLDLLEAGISEQEQARWRVVVPSSELVAVTHLVRCQKDAIRNIRTLSKNNHEAALKNLQIKCKDLGFDDMDLWMTLAWIRELAPILVHVNLDKMMGFMEKDTHYRNQFETASSGGLLKPAVREKWEKDLFGNAYAKAKGFERCKYGVLNAMNDYRGVVKCQQYGDSYMVLKDVRLRCTFSPEDSANLKAERLAVLDYYAHVLYDYSDQELKETMKVAKSSAAAILGDSKSVRPMKYKETQIHGEVAFGKHVERLVAHERHRKDQKRLKAICEKHGWKFSWMDEERKRMEQEDMHKIGPDAWKQKLQELMKAREGEGAVRVPEGFCTKGCGRKVAPGLSSTGKPWKTCCRGCALGFGHDLICGNVDATLLGPGMCRNGCGRKVNPGTTTSGRAFTTCCKSCVKGYHTRTCGGVEEAMTNNVVEPGMCKIGCGRRVATKDGRTFDTCCRGCASSNGEKHSRGCHP